MVTGEWRKILGYGYSCANMVGISVNFHSKQARVIDVWVSEYYRTIESPQSMDRQAIILLHKINKFHYLQKWYIIFHSNP